MPCGRPASRPMRRCATPSPRRWRARRWRAKPGSLAEPVSPTRPAQSFEWLRGRHGVCLLSLSMSTSCRGRRRGGRRRGRVDDLRWIGRVSHRRDLAGNRLAERVHRSDIESIRSVTERNHDAVVTGGVSRGGRAGRVVVDLGKCHRRAGRDRAGEVHRLVTGDPVVEGIVRRVEIDADDWADLGTRAQVHGGKRQIGGGDYAVTE